MPAQIRLGDQVISWGESTFIQNSINSINPVDVSKIRVPGAELKEALIPVGIASASISPTENITFEGFYQYDWEETAIDPTGSYWSTNDFAGKGGRKVMLGWGDTSDLGTSLAALGALRPFFGVDAFESEFLSVSRMADVEASDDGQYGLAMRVFAPNLNDTEFGFYFMNYHSRLPIISAKTGTTANATASYIAAAATALPSPPFPPATTPFAALSGAIGAAAAQQTLGGILINEYAETAHYFIEYPEDIKLYGVSFNTLLNVTGTAIQGEYSYRQDAPLQVDDVELLLAALSPLEATPMGGLFLYDQNQLGTYGENTIIHGYRRLDVSQAQLTATQTFGPTLGADQFIMVGEVGVTHVHDMPSKSTLRMEAPGTYVSGNPTHAAAGGAHATKPAEPSSAFADATSWGYRMVVRMDFNNAIGAVTLSPRIAWAHDVSGTTPGPGGNFIEERKAITLGLGADYQSTWSADLSYTDYFGADRYNLINDRDFVALNIKYSF